MKLKNLFLISTLFFLVLSSWYVLRAVRNELAVENYDQNFLLILLAFTSIVMLLINPIYSWVVSRSNYKKIVVYCYSFLISNLLVFFYIQQIFQSEPLTQEWVNSFYKSIWLNRVFYVWCNIYSFFVVSIFWVLVINIFRDGKSRKFYGIIMAGGSLGAIFGSELAIRLSESYLSSGLELFILSSSILLFLAMLLAVYIFNSTTSRSNQDNIGGKWSDAINNIISIQEVRLIAIYSWMFTALMTIQWISAIPIIQSYSDLSPERIELFGRIEQLVSPLTLISQIFLTYFVISYFGIRFILIIYGILFVLVFSLYGFFPSVGVVVFAQATLRVFEYSFNKPSREIAYSQLTKEDRYKSTVFIDTFLTRFGDLSGSIFVGLSKLIGLGITIVPIITIPFAALFSFVGFKISSHQKFKDL